MVMLVTLTLYSNSYIATSLLFEIPTFNSFRDLSRIKGYCIIIHEYSGLLESSNATIMGRNSFEISSMITCIYEPPKSGHLNTLMVVGRKYPLHVQFLIFHVLVKVDSSDFLILVL